MNRKKLLLMALAAALLLAAGIFFARPRPAPLPALAPEQAIQVRPATETETKEAAAPAPRPKPLLRVRFESTEPGRLKESIPVMLVVESNLPAPMDSKGAQTLDLLLRLPVGVQLESSGWRSMELPKEEQDDPSGPWFLFEKKGAQFQESLRLLVVEPGTNWVITTRARLTRGQESWQAFGAIFATVIGVDVEFHSAPKTPADLWKAIPSGEPSAQTDRP